LSETAFQSMAKRFSAPNASQRLALHIQLTKLATTPASQRLSHPKGVCNFPPKGHNPLSAKRLVVADSSATTTAYHLRVN
ncbi:MAG TPA: hypothetical protein VKG67_01955, partial [Gallionellaceae bacterium]|nr:hypothetical protein [Gallionellaceae bacterium]